MPSNNSTSPAQRGPALVTQGPSCSHRRCHQCHCHPRLMARVVMTGAEAAQAQGFVLAGLSALKSQSSSLIDAPVRSQSQWASPQGGSQQGPVHLQRHHDGGDDGGAGACHLLRALRAHRLRWLKRHQPGPMRHLLRRPLHPRRPRQTGEAAAPPRHRSSSANRWQWASAASPQNQTSRTNHQKRGLHQTHAARGDRRGALCDVLHGASRPLRHRSWPD